MIELTTQSSSGSRRYLLHPDAIAMITEASVSSQWHGIRAFVKLFDGKTLEVSETIDHISKLLEKKSEQC